MLDNSNIPSALIECGYITNADDANNLKDDAKIELMAKNILQGVAMYANNKVDKSLYIKYKMRVQIQRRQKSQQLKEIHCGKIFICFKWKGCSKICC